MQNVFTEWHLKLLTGYRSEDLETQEFAITKNLAKTLAYCEPSADVMDAPQSQIMPRNKHLVLLEIVKTNEEIHIQQNIWCTEPEQNLFARHIERSLTK